MFKSNCNKIKGLNHYNQLADKEDIPRLIGYYEKGTFDLKLAISNNKAKQLFKIKKKKNYLAKDLDIKSLFKEGTVLNSDIENLELSFNSDNCNLNCEIDEFKWGISLSIIKLDKCNIFQESNKSLKGVGRWLEGFNINLKSIVLGITAIIFTINNGIANITSNINLDKIKNNNNNTEKQEIDDLLRTEYNDIYEYNPAEIVYSTYSKNCTIKKVKRYYGFSRNDNVFIYINSQVDKDLSVEMINRHRKGDSFVLSLSDLDQDSYTAKKLASSEIEELITVPIINYFSHKHNSVYCPIGYLGVSFNTKINDNEKGIIIANLKKRAFEFYNTLR